jgi:hypothetical protein
VIAESIARWLNWLKLMLGRTAAADDADRRFVAVTRGASTALGARAVTLLTGLVVVSIEGFVTSRFRDSRDGEGRLSYVSSHSDRPRLISESPVLRIPESETLRIGDLFGMTSQGSKAQ